MKRVPDLDFAIDRAARRRWRKVLLGIIGLAIGLQVGLGVWRWQTLQAAREALVSQQRQQFGKSARAEAVELSAEQLKVAVAAQSMLNSLAVPWENLLAAVEVARTQKILVDAVQPHVEDGTVTISVKCADFAALSEFIDRLEQQDSLLDVMLVSEVRQENAANALQATISAKWRSAK
jgi:hypothetical protein